MHSTIRHLTRLPDLLSTDPRHGCACCWRRRRRWLRSVRVRRYRRQAPSWAQRPDGCTATTEPIKLTAVDAIFRAPSSNNLGVLLSEQNSETARGERWTALEAGCCRTCRVPSRKRGSGEQPRSVRFPASGWLSARCRAVQRLRRAALCLADGFRSGTRSRRTACRIALSVAAAKLTYRNARDLVVLVTANAHLQGGSRLTPVRGLSGRSWTRPRRSTTRLRDCSRTASSPASMLCAPRCG